MKQRGERSVDLCGTRHHDRYERENNKDVIERRQYGVDGDARCNRAAALPWPFELAGGGGMGRPRLGTRLWVRGNTGRFIRPLLAELTNWISQASARREMAWHARQGGSVLLSRFGAASHHRKKATHWMDLAGERWRGA